MTSAEAQDSRSHNELRDTKDRARCLRREKRITQALVEGTTRHNADVFWKNLRQKIDVFRNECNECLAHYLEVLLRYNSREIDTSSTIIELNNLLATRPDSDTAMRCYSLLARLSLTNEDFSINRQYRQQALDISRENHWQIQELVILMNWAFAAASKDWIDEARAKIVESEQHLKIIPKKSLRSTPHVEQIILRLPTHKAKLFLHEANSASTLEIAKDRIEQMNALYREAIARANRHEHFRVNVHIEWAESLLLASKQSVYNVIEMANEALGAASRALDAHSCDFCLGYFHQISAQVTEYEADMLRDWEPLRALQLYRRALNQCHQGETFFKGHPSLQFITETRHLLQEKILMEEAPHKIFLSHRSADKPFVREFHKTLLSLKFSPWFDEDAMTAGVPLDRALRQAFKDSCAVVFFITPEFHDERFLSQEIDYAIDEKRERGEGFSIITLVFRSPDGIIGAVPDLLKRFVWKEPANHLEALREILAAVPMELPYPRRRI